jgi:CheY-like chemotaxis protein
VASYIMKPIRRAELRASIFQATRSVAKQLSSGIGVVPPLETYELMTILVAEDSEDNRFLVEAYLRDEPYKLTFAHDGSEALRLFAKSWFDLILMDVQMPVMDGLTATMRIRDFEREQNQRVTPVVALTANALTEDVERSQAAGCNAHLSKPITKSRLIAAIEQFRNSSNCASADAKVLLIESRPEESKIPVW